jgi:hypothetical protein
MKEKDGEKKNVETFARYSLELSTKYSFENMFMKMSLAFLLSPSAIRSSSSSKLLSFLKTLLELLYLFFNTIALTNLKSLQVHHYWYVLRKKNI